MKISHELNGITLEEMKMLGVTFGVGLAIYLMKEERIRVARKGWNGKDMFLVYQAGYPDGIPINKNTTEATGIQEGTVCKFQPYIMMKTTDGSFVPWGASQTDLLSTDWIVK